MKNNKSLWLKPKNKLSLTALFVVGMALVVAISLTPAASAGTLIKEDNITVSARVPGPPPSQSATIDKPANNQHFTNQDITVSGTCPTGVPIIVEIYRNNVFAGSTDCQNDGTYSLGITLLAGKNQLLAKVRDSLDQYGPDSQITSVYLDTTQLTPSVTPSQTTSSSGTGSSPTHLEPLQIDVAPVFRGTFAGQWFNLSFSIKGGLPPYAVSINWGDGSKQDLVALSTSGEINVRHQYSTEGIYKIVITAVDSQDNSTSIQTVVIINKGTQVPATNTTATSNPTKSNKIRNGVLILALILLLASSFWLGERHEEHEIDSRHQLNPPKN